MNFHGIGVEKFILGLKKMGSLAQSYLETMASKAFAQ